MHHLLLKAVAGVYLQYCMSVNIAQFEEQPLDTVGVGIKHTCVSELQVDG